MGGGGVYRVDAGVPESALRDKLFEVYLVDISTVVCTRLDEIHSICLCKLKNKMTNS